MMRNLITEETFLQDVSCHDWEEVVDATGGVLVEQGSVEPRFLQSIKDTVAEYGAYMVLVDGIALFHGRPEAGVNELAMSLATLREPVSLCGKDIAAALVFAAVDRDSHLELLRELCGFLQDEEFLALLRGHGSREDILLKINKGEGGI